MPQGAGELRLGERVRVTRQDGERAKLAVYGYRLHEHYGDDGVVTGVVESEHGMRYVVRFDEYGRDALPYHREELRRVEAV
ncbi:hypothetical protein [Halobacterium zhouii]|uniref:hypothetical protein n=1 Tax=Halobacterium zhouii TaxID=2902624 RepID=UPI001E38CEE1|nr:hypothetical protein [Halobacterium zhouii]